MSSTASLSPPSYVTPLQQSPQAGVATLIGSFQGNGTSAPALAQYRGSWFSTVTRPGTGHFRVQLTLPIPNDIVATNSSGVANGQPNGLLAEARAWVVSESLQTAPASVFTTGTSKFDFNTNDPLTFDIYTYVAGSAADVTTGDRVFFELKWKNVSYVP